MESGNSDLQPRFHEESPSEVSAHPAFLTPLDMSKFEDIAQVDSMIKKLEKFKEAMRGNPISSSQPHLNSVDSAKSAVSISDFDSLPLINLEELKFDNEEIWLLDSGRSEKTELNREITWDTRLTYVRFNLLNTVKQALDEDRANQINVRLKRNTSYVVRRDCESQERQELSLHKNASPMRDVSASYTYRVPKNRVSPGRMSIFSSEQDSQGNDMPSPILASPPPCLNQTMVLEKTPPPFVDKYATVTRSPKQGLTFLQSPAESNNIETKCLRAQPDLNLTYIRSSEDEAISSPSGSANSPKNNSMEELQSRARQQEQRLRETPIPIRRKDTQVIAYHDVGDAQAKLASRTSSADTYSLGDSNPDSGASSGVSSPRDSQSYENVQLGTTSIGRSMPNLLHLKDPQRGRVADKQVLPHNGQIRSQTRFPSDPRLSKHQSPTRTMGGYREIQQPSYNTYTQRNGDANRNQVPTYKRGDTFYKSRPQVLSIPPQNQAEQTFPQTYLGVGNVQRTDQRHLTRPTVQAQSDNGYDNRVPGKLPANGHKLSYARPSILPQPTGSTGYNFSEESNKVRSRIPAPGIRKHF